MITITILRPNMCNTVVKIENEVGDVKEFRFTDPTKAQRFLEGLIELVPFLSGLSYRVNDYR